LEIFWRDGSGAMTFVFPLFLRVVLENTVFWVWFFDGENVVDCVVNVVR
jgi:hypothetical protein